jgi:hypothetical protein
MALPRAKSADATLPANSGATPGTTTTLVAADAAMQILVFQATFALGSAAGATHSLVEIGVVGTATKKYCLNAGAPTFQATFPEGLYVAQNTALTARVLGNGGGVAVQCNVDYMLVIPE